MQKNPFHNSNTIMLIKAKKFEIQQKRIEFNQSIQVLLDEVKKLEKKRIKELEDFDRWKNDNLYKST
jgi:hypothetical protein